MKKLLFLLLLVTPSFAQQVQIADNFAALKALNPLSRHNKIFVSGHTTPGDGGGGMFFWDSTSVGTDDNGIVLQATGVGIGRWKRHVDHSVSVRYYGATDNGALDDDTAAFQKAIAYAQLNKRAVYVPAGTYRTTSTLVITNAINIFGDGIRGHSTIKLDGDFDGIMLNWSDVSISDLTIDGDGTTGDGIVVRGSSTKIRDCTIINCRDGVRLGNPLSVGQANDCLLEGIRVTSNSRDGIHISHGEDDVGLADANANTLIRINAQQNGRDGLHINKSLDNAYLSILSESNGRYGVLVTTNGVGHTFYSVYAEANTTAQLRLEGRRNMVDRWRGGVGNDEVQDVGEGNMVVGWTGAHGWEPVYKSTQPFLDLRIYSPGTSDGQWQFRKDDVERALWIDFIRSGANPAQVFFTNSLSGSPGGRSYVYAHTYFADRVRPRTLIPPAEAQFRTSMNEDGPFNVLSFAMDNIQLLFDYDYTNGHIARATSIGAIKKISDAFRFYGSTGNTPGDPANEILRAVIKFSNGNFGVGTDIDPVYKLDVDGHVRIRFGTNTGRLWLGGDGTNAATISLSPGAGSPVGTFTAFPGSLRLSTNGTAWLKESGGDDTTGWAQILTTSTGGGGGDFTINESDGFIPYRTNATKLTDSPLKVVGAGVVTDGTYSAQGYGNLGTLDYSALTMGHTGTNGSVVIHSVSSGDAGPPRDFLFQANGATQARIAADSGYTGAGTEFLSDDGTYKPVAGGGGTTINDTDNYLPFRTNATTFADSPLRASGDDIIASGDYVSEGFGTVGGADYSALILGHTGTNGSVILHSTAAGTAGAARDFLFLQNGTTAAKIASPSGYAGSGEKFLSDDGTYKFIEGGTGGGGSGTVVGDLLTFEEALGSHELMNAYTQIVFDDTPMQTTELSPGTYIVTAVVDYNQYRTNGNQLLVKLVNSETTFDIPGTVKLNGPQILAGEFYGNWNVTVQGKVDITTSGVVEVWAQNAISEDEEATPRSAVTTRSSISWMRITETGGDFVQMTAPQQTITGNVDVAGAFSANSILVDEMEIDDIYLPSTNLVLQSGSDGILTNVLHTGILKGDGTELTNLTNTIGIALVTGSTSFVDIRVPGATNTITGSLTYAHATNGSHSVNWPCERWLLVPSGGPHAFTIPSGWRTNVYSAKPAALTNGTIYRMVLSSLGPTDTAARQTNILVSFEAYR